jgi:hypothetical protein
MGSWEERGWKAFGSQATGEWVSLFGSGPCLLAHWQIPDRLSGPTFVNSHPGQPDSPQDTNLASEPRSHIKQPSDSEDLDKNG